MKLEITGRVDHVSGIEPLKKGFRQIVILEQPETRDDWNRLIYAQYFPIVILSNEQADSRFLGSKDMKAKKKAVVYLKGERWINERDRNFNYAIKLTLSQWLS